MARRITEVDDLLETVDLPLFPWQGGDKGQFVRVTPEEVTGRRFTVVDPSAWTAAEDIRRTVSPGRP